MLNKVVRCLQHQERKVFNMYTILMNDGEYREINATSRQQAEIIMHNMYSEEEIAEKEMELVE